MAHTTTPSMHTIGNEQTRAIAPHVSIWLSANAGAGKTRVLTRRVAALLFHGTPPERILCLTYTEAAALEMQNRLYALLGKWALLADDALQQELADLVGDFGTPLTTATMQRARTLFAQAIETPGGLRIQTIHGLCHRLLRTYPIEAGIAPDFMQIDDAAERDLYALALNRLALDNSAAIKTALEHLAAADIGNADSDQSRVLANEILSSRQDFITDIVPSCKRILPLFELQETDTLDSFMHALFVDATRDEYTDMFAALAAHLDANNRTQAKAKRVLSTLNIHTPLIETLIALESIFLKGGKTKTPFASKAGEFPSKSAWQALPATIKPLLTRFIDRLADYRPHRIALVAANKSIALHNFACAFLDAYDIEKQNRSMLDFDDLIARTVSLLTTSVAAGGVLYQLHQHIDHILVDEAQDTTPLQWQLIGALTEGFDEKKTLFVVGDSKQLIYAFQGVNPRDFINQRTHLAKQLETNNNALLHRELHYNYRSGAAILRAVDAVFADPQACRAVGAPAPPVHVPFYTDLPCRVDCWPAVPHPDKSTEALLWHTGDYTTHAAGAEQQLADKIAAFIASVLGTCTVPIYDDPNGAARPIAAGDIMILVRKRGSLFNTIIQTCQAANLPVAGADRLKLKDALAVRDLCVVLRFLDMPKDDLSLAIALKSPLFGISEADLYTLAHLRGAGESLWGALQQRARNTQTDAHTRMWRWCYDILYDLRKHQTDLSIYALLERMLIDWGGRQRLLTRLGVQCRDGIDALLAEALAFEQTNIATLSGFLTYIDNNPLEIKRQVPSNENKSIRIITVHGAKGSEAPIVIIPDTATVDFNTKARMDNLVLAKDTKQSACPLWRIAGEQTPPVLETIQNNDKNALIDEDLRLLYVAITRARQWLVVCGIEPKRERDDRGWHERLSSTVQAAGAAIDTPCGQGHSMISGKWDMQGNTPTPPSPTHTNPAPVWLFKPYAAQPDSAVDTCVFTPSQLADSTHAESSAHAQTSMIETERTVDFDYDARLYGQGIHTLLEHLPHVPRSDWQHTATLLLSNHSTSMQNAIYNEIIRILDNQDLQFLLTTNAIREAALNACIDGISITGQIDCLVIDAHRCLIVDFKSNRIVPTSATTIPQGILVQIGCYALMVAQTITDKPLETAILWTNNADLMRLPMSVQENAIDQARARMHALANNKQ